MSDIYRIILLKTQDEETNEDWWSAKLFSPGKVVDTEECDSLEGVMSEVLKACEPEPCLKLVTVSDEPESLGDELAMDTAKLNKHGGEDYTIKEMRAATELCYESQAASELSEMVEQLLEFVVHVESLQHAADCSPCSSPTCILGHQAAKVLGR